MSEKKKEHTFEDSVREVREVSEAQRYTPAPIREMFSKLPTASKVEAFNNDRAFGVIISFAEKDFGFGEITLSVEKGSGVAMCDLEHMTHDHCGEILMRAVGTKVMGAE